MREIKFRAWDEVEGKFRTLLDLGDVSGEGSVQFSVGYAGELQIGRLEEFHNGVGFDTTFTKFPIVQFTGSKDANGVEIFEGDILQSVDDESYMSVVKYCTDGIGSCGCCYDEFEGAGFKAKDLRFKESIVVGNIYENPELLGDSQ
ncbi:YopX family protein [Lysinibacillus fusiformis]|uniref:YopX family protein n=1 Tax=Lysinibacillus fusiformis TaxID=28031 RepID=UPI001F4E811B|nr:YopX family protein [Lysinibacillus fusiformis]MCK1989451.1 YopX family protein [Lysinibacillus fusiformis]